MKKFTTFKTLLVGLLALGATSAWADLVEGTSTIVNFDNQTTPFVIHDGNRLGVSYALQEGSETDYYAKYNCGNRNALPFAKYDFSSIVAKAEKVVISFDYNIPNGIAGSAYISLSDKDIHNATNGGYNVNNKNSVWGTNGVILAIGNHRASGANFPAVNNANKSSVLQYNTWYTANITVDLSQKKVSYTIKAKGNETALDSGTDMDFWNTAEGTKANTCNQIDISMANTGGIYIDNISITPYTNNSEKYAGYTIKYMFGETELKTAVTDRDEVKVGEKVNLIPDDLASIKVGDKKYIYDSDDSSTQTIKEDGTTIITVTFREAGNYRYTLNAIDSSETELKILDEGDAFEGDKGYAYGVKAFYMDDVLYSTSVVDGFQKEFSEEGTQSFSYENNTTWAYFTEVEDMTVSRDWAANGMYPAFYSNGRAVRFYPKAYAYTAPLAEGGTYKVTMWARNNSSNSTANVGLYYRDAEGNLVPTNKTFEDWGTAERKEHSVEGIGIPAGCSFVIKNENPDNNNNLEMDYIFLEKTSSEAPALADRTATIGENGFSTFASAYNVEIPSDVKAYTGKVNEAGTAVKFTQITTGAIPANTGVLLEGTPGGIALKVVESASALTDNDFIAGAGKALTAAENTTYFAMDKSSNELTFGKIADGVVVPADKAYLAVAAGAIVPESARLTVTFDGEATGIKTVENAKAGKAIYNLNGQRVNKAQKGLYIVNGKKTIIK